MPELAYKSETICLYKVLGDRACFCRLVTVSDIFTALAATVAVLAWHPYERHTAFCRSSCAINEDERLRKYSRIRLNGRVGIKFALR